MSHNNTIACLDLVGIAIVLWLSACGTSSSLPTTTPPSGTAVFASVCAQCHGARGEGTLGPAPALDATGHAWHHADQQLREWIKKGKFGLGVSMPAQGDKLTDAEIEAVIAFIKTWWTDEQRAAQQDITRRTQ